MSQIYIPEEWEQDFSELSPWIVIKPASLETYFEAAIETGVRLAYKTRGSDMRLFAEEDQDMSELLKIVDTLRGT